MDSTETQITYFNIRKRAKQDALDRMPDLPDMSKPRLVGTSEADLWSMYIDELSDLDAFEIANESAEWDWVIYYHKAMELCQAVPSAVLHEAESEYNDFGGFGDLDVGLYELASHLAHLIVVRAIMEAVEECRDELLELANDELLKLESA